MAPKTNGNGDVASPARLVDRQKASAGEILDAAAKAFARRGYAATSIDDVADELGCTKGRIYHYFRTKGELFIGIHHRSLVWALEAIRPALDAEGLEPAERLRRMVHGHATHMMERADYMGPAQHHTEMNLAREGRTKDDSVAEIFAMRHEFEAAFVGVVEQGIADGSFRAGDPGLIAKAVLGSVNWMSVWFHAGSSMDTPAERARIAAEFSSFAVDGVLV